MEKWETDRGCAEELKNTKENLAGLEAKLAAKEKIGDYKKATDLKYGAIPDLKTHIEEIINEAEELKSEQAEKIDDDDSMTFGQQRKNGWLHKWHDRPN